MATIHETILRSQRAAILGELLRTMDSQIERADLIGRLRRAAIISDATAEMLFEIYVAEAV